MLFNNHKYILKLWFNVKVDRINYIYIRIKKTTPPDVGSNWILIHIRIFQNSLNDAGFTIEYYNTLYTGIAYNSREYAEMYIVKNSKEWEHRIDFNQKKWDYYKQ